MRGVTAATAAVALAAMLSACAGGTPSAPATAPASSPPPASASQQTVSQVPATASVAPTPTATPVPTAAVPTAGVTIVNEGTSQFELFSPGGQRILVDIASPFHLTSPATAADVLLTTHYHEDHYNSTFVNAFPGKALTVEEGTLTAGDVKIRSIAAAHNQGDAITAKDATDYVFIIDIGGIRVVVFGDLGQDALTAAQLKAIGTVDVAISQLDNSVSDVTPTNRKAIAQMDQVRPRILIPTHDSLDGAKMAASAWPVATTGTWVTITRDRLPATLTVLFMGDTTASLRTTLGITSPPW